MTSDMLKAQKDKFELYEGRKVRLVKLENEGLVVIELRHRRELRRRDRHQRLLMLWAASLALLWLGTCLLGLRLVHENRNLAQKVVAQQGTIENLCISGNQLCKGNVL